MNDGLRNVACFDGFGREHTCGELVLRGQGNDLVGQVLFLLLVLSAPCLLMARLAASTAITEEGDAKGGGGDGDRPLAKKPVTFRVCLP